MPDIYVDRTVGGMQLVSVSVTTHGWAKNEDKHTPLTERPARLLLDLTHLDVLHELPHVAVPVRGHVAV